MSDLVVDTLFARHTSDDFLSLSMGRRPVRWPVLRSCGAYGMGEPIIYVDADACPVKDEALRVAMRHRLTIAFVANQGSRPTRDPMIRYVYVPYGPDAADDWIVEQGLKPGDKVIVEGQLRIRPGMPVTPKPFQADRQGN